jgi:SAM-dependent methyltransferase
MTDAGEPQRLCPACGAGEVAADEAPLWPPGWRCSSCGHAVAQRDGIPMYAPALADTVTGFDPDCFARLTAHEESHFWFVARNALIVGLAGRFFPDARRYLEIGCGNGAVLGALAASRRWERLVGSELHPRGLANARRRLPDVEFVQMDAGAIPAVAAFDLTGAFDVLEHVADDEAVLRSLKRATRPGGGTILAVPQHPFLWSRADEIAHHQRRYRRGELEAKLRRNGFHVLFSSSFNAVLLPLMVVSRWRARGKRGDREIEREFAVGPFANRLLAGILRGEVALTLSGLCWPLGGSRVVVARAA